MIGVQPAPFDPFELQDTVVGDVREVMRVWKRHSLHDHVHGVADRDRRALADHECRVEGRDFGGERADWPFAA